MKVQFLGHKDPLEEEMVTHSSILAWKIPKTERHGRLQSMESQRVRYNKATQHIQTYCILYVYMLKILPVTIASKI